MCEDRPSALLIPLVAAGARSAASTRSGRRFVLVVGHERQPISQRWRANSNARAISGPCADGAARPLVVQHLRRRAGEVIARRPIHARAPDQGTNAKKHVDDLTVASDCIFGSCLHGPDTRDT
ncbi:exported hypothetical protein [Thiomonas arsenitoxydans]|nr:exported hypothetical protein [Thiomonas sp. CB2]CQR31506.1 exported hypothetical protein [Thiomonas arsenitoxydans]CQR43927.1 exported hypothetical protein [Thiomonas sp. CB3]CQR36198.1 exported hypothetical protein [Thiomonas arsenitoxydans]CQR44585.1 exported hypothetical protein [Thiomonas sp. CB3]